MKKIYTTKTYKIWDKSELLPNIHRIILNVPDRMRCFPLSFKFVYPEKQHYFITERYAFLHVDEIISMIDLLGNDKFELRITYHNYLKKKDRIHLEYTLSEDFTWQQLPISEGYVVRVDPNDLKSPSLLDIDISDFKVPVNLRKTNQMFWSIEEL